MKPKRQKKLIGKWYYEAVIWDQLETVVLRWLDQNLVLEGKMRVPIKEDWWTEA